MDAQKLEGLASMTAEADAEGGPTPEQVEEQQQADAAEDRAREWGVIAYTVGGALSMLAPELRQVYTEDACMNWGRSVVPVADKYGWNGPGNVPELGLLMATATLAVPSYLVIRAKLQAMREAREAAERAAKARSGQVEDAKVVGDGG